MSISNATQGRREAPTHLAWLFVAALWGGLGLDLAVGKLRVGYTCKSVYLPVICLYIYICLTLQGFLL